MPSKKWVVEFQTTEDASDCRVWGWGACSIDSPNEFDHGTGIDSFLEWAQTKDNPSCWIYNLKFGAQFIISRLLALEYKWTTKHRAKPQTFSTLITAANDYYGVKIVFDCDGHKTKALNIFDSLKLLNMSMEVTVASFGIPLNPQKIPKAPRPEGYIPNMQELFAIQTNCKILASALKTLFDNGVKGITLSQSAMADFKSREPNFSSYFPKLSKEVEDDIRQAYKGGFTYLNPIYKEKETGAGFFLDKNSMFPWQALQHELPIGRPVYFEGKYKPSVCFPLYIQKMTFAADLKPGKTPFLRSKNSPDYSPLDYIESTNGELITFTLTSVEVKLLFENYDVHDITYHSGWKFSSCRSVFNKYVYHWAKEKQKADEAGNKGARVVAKMYLNALFGKFGTRNTGRQRMPVLNSDGVVEYKPIGKEERKSVYSPIALFITAYARVELCKTIEKIRKYGFKKYGRDVYVYSDTDSIAVTLNIEDMEDLDKIIRLDKNKMGAWKLEKVFAKAKFIHAKCYMTIDPAGIPHATIAGMPRELSKRMKFENFEIGFTTENLKEDPELERLISNQPMLVPGGVVLAPCKFEIK